MRSAFGMTGFKIGQKDTEDVRTRRAPYSWEDHLELHPKHPARRLLARMVLVAIFDVRTTGPASCGKFGEEQKKYYKREAIAWIEGVKVNRKHHITFEQCMEILGLSNEKYKRMALAGGNLDFSIKNFVENFLE